MTIPRIGDKIVRVNKSSNTPAPVEDIAPVEEQNTVIGEEVIEQAEVAEFEDASLDDIFDDEEELLDASEEDAPADDQTDETESESESESEQEQEEVSVINSRHPEDNYSIDKFTEEFSDNFHKDALPMLVQYDSERKQGLILTCLIAGVLAFSAIAFLVFSDFDKRLYVSLLLLIFSVMAWFFTKNQLEKKVKNGVIPILMKAIPNFSWVSENPIPEDDINDCKIFPNSKDAVKNFYGAIDGQYRGVNISMVESKYIAEKQELFSGVILRLQVNKEFLGTTIIRPKKDVLVKTVKDLKKLRYQKYELNNAELNKLYNVYTSDQEDARMLLTPEFIECFQNIYTAFGANVGFCSCFGKYVYIAPYCKDVFMGKKDMFNICNLFKSVADEAQYAILYNELTSVMALVDCLKLVKKLGL